MGPALVISGVPTVTNGVRLEPKSAAFRQATLEAREAQGRTGKLDLQSFSSLARLARGTRIQIPLFDGESLSGVVNLVRQEAGWIRAGGRIDGAQSGSFMFASDGAAVHGLVQLPREELAYEISAGPDGELLVREKSLAEVVCFLLPRPRRAALAPAAIVTRDTPPSLSSRPAAAAVLYLDFDGATVSDPAWNNGDTIFAAPARFSAGQMTQVWARVAEDYRAFNIDITTIESRYENAAIGKRMRCIITPTDYWMAETGAGGISYVGSFRLAGNAFTADVPAWVFIDDIVKDCAEATAHELGHTLGLGHDGVTSPTEEYYTGSGSGPTGWAPIMGASFYQELTQWSKGEYPNANNKEDDIAIIAGGGNGFGYALDEAGSTRAAAATLSISNGLISQSGVISRASDWDFFTFATTGGSVAVTADPAPTGPDLDLEVELLDVNGALIASSNPAGDLSANISENLSAGTYYLRVRGIGEGNPPANGYTSYGSIGAYSLTGTLQEVLPAPVITSGASAGAASGSSFSYQITATNSPTSFSVAGSLPAGLNLDAGTGLITGVLGAEGVFSISVGATNENGTGTKNVTLTVGGPIANALDLPSASFTAGGAGGWFGQSVTAHDGVSAAQSPSLDNAEQAWFETTFTGPRALTFWWKVSSQSGHDFLRCQLDGAELFRISGAVDWQMKAVSIPAGEHLLRWIYAKDGAASSGADAAWVDELRITRAPLSVTVNGEGVVTARYRGITAQPLAEALTIAATPKAGAVFDRWSGSFSSFQPRLTFTMEEGLALAANFAPTPYAPFTGNYSALLSGSPASNGTAGVLRFLLNANGKFSAVLQLGGRTSRFTGQFDARGNFSAPVPRTGAGSLLVTLALDLENGGALAGSATDGTLTATLSGGRGAFNAQTNPAPQAGAYTALLEPASGAPAGVGYARISVSPAGAVRFMGRLGDGTTANASGNLAANGAWPLYLLLYRSSGSISGALTIDADTVSGSLRWSKGQVTGETLYAAGFDADATVRGARFVPPPPGAALLPSVPNATARIDGGNLGSAGPIEQPVTITSANKVAIARPNDNLLTLSIAPSTGVLTGSFRHPVLGTVVRFNGLLVPAQGRGGGLFRAVSETGSFVLVPAPAP